MQEDVRCCSPPACQCQQLTALQADLASGMLAHERMTEVCVGCSYLTLKKPHAPPNMQQPHLSSALSMRVSAWLRVSPLVMTLATIGS
jgi:hypothetical protein